MIVDEKGLIISLRPCNDSRRHQRSSRDRIPDELSLDSGEATCPLCKSVASTLLPEMSYTASASVPVSVSASTALPRTEALQALLSSGRGATADLFQTDRYLEWDSAEEWDIFADFFQRCTHQSTYVDGMTDTSVTLKLCSALDEMLRAFSPAAQLSTCHAEFQLVYSTCAAVGYTLATAVLKTIHDRLTRKSDAYDAFPLSRSVH